MSKTIDQFTLEELLGEVARRGVVLPAGMLGLGGTETTQQTVFNVLGAFERYWKEESRKLDKDRAIKVQFMCAINSDWARNCMYKGYCIDALKSVTVGLGEDRDGTQIIILKVVDTEQKMNDPGDRYSRDRAQPPCWGVAFTAEEMRALTAGVVEKAASEGTMLHREPQGDIEPDEPWFVELHWLVENGKVAGIISKIKCTQDDQPEVSVCRFKARGNTFEQIGEEEKLKPSSAAAGGGGGGKPSLPAPTFEGRPAPHYPEEKALCNSHAATGDSPMG